MPNLVRSRSRLLALAVALVLAGPGPAAGQVEIETFVSASSADEVFEPYDFADDYAEDASDVAGEGLHVGTSACIDPCVLIPPHVWEAEAEAETDFGSNLVDVWSQSWSAGSNSSYQDQANASSRWQDELTFSSEVPDLIGSVRATFRIQGSWDNRACFVLVTWLYDPASAVPGCVGDCCNCPTVASVAGASNQSASDCEPIVPFGPGGASFPTLFPDFDQEDGEADITAFVELPLILDAPLRFGAALVAATGGLDQSDLDGSGVTAVVESLDVPAGVQADSAANALAAYHVNAPEPGAGASAAVAAALRARRHVLRG